MMRPHPQLVTYKSKEFTNSNNSFNTSTFSGNAFLAAVPTSDVMHDVIRRARAATGAFQRGKSTELVLFHTGPIALGKSVHHYLDITFGTQNLGYNNTNSISSSNNTLFDEDCLREDLSLDLLQLVVAKLAAEKNNSVTSGGESNDGFFATCYLSSNSSVRVFGHHLVGNEGDAPLVAVHYRTHKW